MAFFVKKSALFLLTILLLICSSHANSYRGGDRKLLGLGVLLGKGIANKLAPALKGTRMGNKVDGAPTPVLRGPSKRSGESVSMAPWELTEITAKKIGETVVGRLFGSNGKTAFRVGWKAGKLYYKVEDRCQNYQNSHLVNCKTVPNCHAEVSCFALVDGNTGNVDQCFDGCRVLARYPCTYLDGAIYGDLQIPFSRSKMLAHIVPLYHEY